MRAGSERRWVLGGEAMARQGPVRAGQRRAVLTDLLPRLARGEPHCGVTTAPPRGSVGSGQEGEEQVPSNTATLGAAVPHEPHRGSRCVRNAHGLLPLGQRPSRDQDQDQAPAEGKPVSLGSASGGR